MNIHFGKVFHGSSSSWPSDFVIEQIHTVVGLARGDCGRVGVNVAFGTKLRHLEALRRDKKWFVHQGLVNVPYWKFWTSPKGTVTNPCSWNLVDGCTSCCSNYSRIPTCWLERSDVRWNSLQQIWRLPEIGVPPVSILILVGFSIPKYYKPSSYGGTPFQETSISDTSHL